MTRAIATACLLFSCATAAAQQPRDNRPRLGSGTAAVHGVVRGEGTDRAPLRRTKVTINSVEIEFARTVITGDDGAFQFAGLPAGRYTVMASKDGYLTTSAGARRFGRFGTIELQAGGNARVDITMVRGAVITGRVQMSDGEPAAGISVQALRFDTSGPLDERRLAPAGIPAVTTDDRGEYRVFGLAPGTYYLRAQPRFQMVPGAEDGLHVPTAAEIRAALAEVRVDATSARPGIPERPRPIATAPHAPRRGVTLAPIYFPSTSIPGRAAAITLRPAEVRTSVDIDLEYVPLSTVEGFVAIPSGSGNVTLTISSAEKVAGGFSRTARSGQDGAFMFRGVPPGTYTITARLHSVFSSGGGPLEPYWGTTDVVVSGEDLSGVSVSLQPGLTIQGQVIFEATSGIPSQLGRIAVPQIQAANLTFASVMLPPVTFDGQSFALEGVIPGTYRFAAVARGVRSAIGRWWLKSFVVNGTEMLDQELEIKASTDSAVVTFSDRASELTGTAQYASGLAVRDEMVVVFSTDPRHWFHGSRRIAPTRPSEAGRYIVRNLPEGDYFVAVTGELTQSEWYDVEELKNLSREAMVVRIGKDERIVQDLRLNR
jgi:hypothetical protein